MSIVARWRIVSEFDAHCCKLDVRGTVTPGKTLDFEGNLGFDQYQILGGTRRSWAILSFAADAGLVTYGVEAVQGRYRHQAAILRQRGICRCKQS
jgi:hypothetical protein